MRTDPKAEAQIAEHLQAIVQILRDHGCNGAEVKEYLLGLVMQLCMRMDGLMSWVLEAMS